MYRPRMDELITNELVDRSRRKKYWPTTRYKSQSDKQNTTADHVRVRRSASWEVAVETKSLSTTLQVGIFMDCI